MSFKKGRRANLAQTANLVLPVTVKERERPQFPQCMPKGCSWVPNTMMQKVLKKHDVVGVSKTGPDSQFGASWLSIGGKGALNSLVYGVVT